MCLAAVFPQPGGGGRALPVRPSLRPIQVIEIAGFDLFLALFGRAFLLADPASNDGSYTPAGACGDFGGSTVLRRTLEGENSQESVSLNARHS